MFRQPILTQAKNEKIYIRLFAFTNHYTHIYLDNCASCSHAKCFSGFPRRNLSCSVSLGKEPKIAFANSSSSCSGFWVNNFTTAFNLCGPELWRSALILSKWGFENVSHECSVQLALHQAGTGCHRQEIPLPKPHPYSNQSETWLEWHRPGPE